MFDPAEEARKFRGLLKQREQNFTRSTKGREASFCQLPAMKIMAKARKMAKQGMVRL